MVLIIGGAYQGKLDHAKAAFAPNGQVFAFGDVLQVVPSEAQVLDHVERYVLALLDAGRDPLAVLEQECEAWQGKIVICEDINCGVVPIDARMRAWREANGRCMALLALKADRVDRVFCGLAQTIKPCG